MAIKATASDVSEHPRRWLTSRQAAEHTGYKLGTLHNMTARGEIPFHKVRGRLRFLVAELDEWMKEQAEKAVKAEKQEEAVAAA